MSRTIVLVAVVTVVPFVTNVASGATKVAVLKTGIEGEAALKEVPSLIDDYVLTAVQDLGDHEVIGPDDVSAVIGFEKEKELLGCDDVACMADIAGALGVDEIVVFKVARAGSDWATTAKLIDIRNMRVKSRTTDFVAGGSRELLGAVPALMKKLFEGGGSTTAAIAPVAATQAASPEPAPAPAVNEPTSDESPVYKKGWFWAVVGGAVVVAVVVGVVVATSGGDVASQTAAPANNSSSGTLISW